MVVFGEMLFAHVCARNRTLGPSKDGCVRNEGCGALGRCLGK